jgi:hypothetical protein
VKNLSIADTPCLNGTARLSGSDLLPLLVDQYIDSEDEQIILGVFELLLGYRNRDAWAPTIETWFRITTLLDL